MHPSPPPLQPLTPPAQQQWQIIPHGGREQNELMHMVLKPETAGITVFRPQEGSSIAFTYQLQMFHYKKGGGGGKWWTGNNGAWLLLCMRHEFFEWRFAVFFSFFIQTLNSTLTQVLASSQNSLVNSSLSELYCRHSSCYKTPSAERTSLYKHWYFNILYGTLTQRNDESVFDVANQVRA